MNAVPWSAQLRGLAARFGDAPAVTAPHGGTLSYAALSERAHALAEMLAARGTECFNPITVLEAPDTHDWFAQQPVPPGACVDWPAPGVEIDIRDGQVWLRAGHLCDELLGPEGPIPHEDGWHATGDLGCVDERGRLVQRVRLADVIKTGGYRVNPDEIEVVQRVLKTHQLIDGAHPALTPEPRAVAALQLERSPEETALLQAPYVPHGIAGQ